MRMRSFLAIAASMALLAATALQSRGATASQTTKVAPGQPVVMPAAGLKWTNLDPKGAPGVKVAESVGRPLQGCIWRVLQASRRIRCSPPHTHA